jgi:hypothetical protein
MFKFPLAASAAVWTLIESAAEAENVEVALYVWDVAYMCHNAIRMNRKPGSSQLFFKVTLPLIENGTEHKLKLVCGPGDNGEPVLTIMLPEED